MGIDYDALKKNDTWTLVPLPSKDMGIDYDAFKMIFNFKLELD